jgi:hypothetical protein
MKRDALAALAANRYWAEADGRAALAAWRASGESVAAFAARHGLGAKRLVRWQRRLAAPPLAPPTGFASLELITSAAADPITIRVGAIEIVAPNASPAWVAALVTELTRSA